MNYSLSFRFRIWVRQWFFRPFAGWQTAIYKYKQNRKKALFIESIDDLNISLLKEGDKKP